LERLPGGRIPADTDPRELRRERPFGFSAAPVEQFVELAKRVGPQVARIVLGGCDKYSVSWGLDPDLILGELLAPYRPPK
jgi:hypothetical protein